MIELSMKSPLWANTGHLQTMLGYLISGPEPQDIAKKDIFTFADQDQIDFLHYDYSSQYVYIFFHGLAGSYQSNYMKRAESYCQKNRKTYYLFNHRGAGDIKTKNIYHSGRAVDAAEIIQYVRTKHPGKYIVATGYSMSANILLLLNGKFSDRPQADVYISINGPIDLKSCSQLLGQGFNRIYDQKFVKDLRSKLSHDERRITRGVNVYDFDNLYTAPRGGFQDRDDYYEQCSAANWVSQLQKKHFVLMSKDDPFIPFWTYERARWGKMAQINYTRRGGHLGYLTSQPVNAEYGIRWLDFYLANIFNEIELLFSSVTR